MEEELSKMVAQLKAICAEVGIPEGRNCRLTVQALKAAETEPELSNGSNSEGEEDNSPGEGEPLDGLMRKVLKELTSLNLLSASRLTGWMRTSGWCTCLHSARLRQLAQL